VAAIHLRTLGSAWRSAPPPQAPRGRVPAARENARAYAGEDTITRCDGRGTWLVALHGEHDLSTIPLLDEQTRHVWPQCAIAVIDLSEVTFIDSSLIHWLLRVERTLEAAHVFTLSVVTGPPDGAAGKLFERLGMNQVFACYGTRRDVFTQAVADADGLAWLAPERTMR
jgi:anti-anti-sigma regulatory factor